MTTALVPEQLEVWAAAARRDGVELHVTGAMVHDRSESYLADLAIPTWGETHVLRPTGWIERGRLWWNLDGLETLIDYLAPDVVHVHSEAWGRLVAQALRRPVPVAAHGAENVSLVHGNPIEARLRAHLTHRNAVRLAGYASWNAEGVAILREAGLAATAPTAVAPAIVPDPTPFLQARRQRPTDARPIQVGYVGRLVPEKGVHWLVHALDGVPDVELVVIGSGPYEAHLRRLAERRGVPTRFVGPIDGAAMPAAVADLDMVVVPSLERPGWAEQFGRVVCEAMLTGVPVISSDSGSLAAVVGDGGLVVPELDHDALRRSLLDVIQSPQRRLDVGAAGRTWAVERLVPEAAATELLAMWSAMAGRR